MRFDDILLRFFRDDMGGVMIVNEKGEALYKDERADEVLRDARHWDIACPPPRADQRGEVWDLPSVSGGRSYTVVTSTFVEDSGTIQVHHFADNSVYMALFRDISDYSRALKAEKERDDLTGLYNKGKLMELKRTLLGHLDAIDVFNMDVNNLKHMNDTYGHEAGDRLIRKAAESLRRIEARNVMAFRVGGDEFLVVALHVSPAEAEALRRTWEDGLAELNRRDDGVECVVACGMACGERGYDLEAVLALADQRMYEDKKAKKRGAGDARSREADGDA